MLGNWLANNEITQEISQRDQQETSSLMSSLAPFDHAEPEQSSNPMQAFFVPGWKGESLTSKSVKKFSQTLDHIHRDVFDIFFSKVEFSRKLKISIYTEFLSYAEFKAINCTNLDHYTVFWTELKNLDSMYKKEIHNFFNILSFRVAVIYLLKTRFILEVKNRTHSEFDLKNLYNPNSFLTKMFKTASSTELKSRAFEQNIFNWYRPSEKLKNDLSSLKDIYPDLNITDIIKTISLKSEKVLAAKTGYSHTISHKHFGLFLNNLLVNFPIWLNSLAPTRQTHFTSLATGKEIISTKFTGDYLESLSLSHWLAQNTNKSFNWDQVICPDFKNDDFSSGLYHRTINELQFLTFLAEIANTQGQEPKVFISNIVNSHLYNRKNSDEAQKNLLLNESSLSSSTYDRVVLNLIDFPKNNPQHYLFTQIANQKQFLKDNGYLLVITTKKLFVPSQKNRIETLLEDYKVECIFDLEHVKGKGELGSFIYIFSKQQNSFSSKRHKHSCLNFRFAGELEAFHEFHHLTKLSQDFFSTNLRDLPPLYQRNINDFNLEFYQDAIVNGQLIHSSSKDSNKVTHPIFFQKLIKVCNSLDYFFEIQNIDFDQELYEEENSLFNFSQSFKREESPFTIIVDQRVKEDIKLEIIQTSSLELKAYEYGHALCTYFHAYSKWPNLNVLAIKNFFESSIGKQIINLTFSNEIRKVKGNLNKLFIPKCLTAIENIPEHISPGLQILSLTEKDLLSTHPSSLEQSYSNIQAILPTLVRTYPSRMLALLSHFKNSTDNALRTMNCTNKSNSINFNNPMLKTPLLLSKTYPIYPDNKDVFTEFNPEGLDRIHHPLSSIKKTSKKTNDYTNYALELYVEDLKIITLYSDENMVTFIEFLLENVLQTPVAKILQGIQVPKLDDLQSIILSHDSLHRSLSEIVLKVNKDFDQLVNSIIVSQ